MPLGKRKTTFIDFSSNILAEPSLSEAPGLFFFFSSVLPLSLAGASWVVPQNGITPGTLLSPTFKCVCVCVF